MKRILALILSVLMIATLASCSGSKETTADAQTTKAPETTTAPETTDTTAPETTEAPKSTVALETIAKALADKYAEYADLRTSFDDMMKDMDEADRIPYEDFLASMLPTMPVEDFEYLSGLTEVPEGIKEAYLYQPGMMGQAYIGYIFRLTEGTDVEAFKKSLTEKADLRWNICTMANTIVCENYGDTVFFSMMVVADAENPSGFTAEQKDGFIKTFMDTVSAK